MSKAQNKFESSLQSIQFQVIWRRLISIVEEQARTPDEDCFQPRSEGIRGSFRSLIRPPGANVGASGHRYPGSRKFNGGCSTSFLTGISPRKD